MALNFSSDVVAKSIWQRILRDSLVTQESDIFWPFKETKAIVPYLLPMMCPPSLILPVRPSNESPQYSHVKQFLDTAVEGCNIQTECCVLALIYIDRIRCLVSLKPATWKIVVVAALSLAIKMWDDSARHWPRELAMATDVSETKICGAEVVFCQLLEFRLHVDGEEYREYHSVLFKPAESQTQFRRTKSRI